MNSGQGTMGSAVGNGRRALSEEVPVGYKRTEVGVIPEEWQATRIGDLFESTAGGDFDPTRSSDVQSDSHPYPIYANGLSQEGLYGFCNYAENRSGSITVTARGTLGKAFYRDTPFVALGRLLVLEPKVRMDARFFFNYINHGVHFAVESTGVPQLTAPQVTRYLLPVPPESEQRAIAEALSDVDGLLAALEALIAKKRAIKRAAMQQLLTGKSRLPGFRGAWETKRLGDVGRCLRGVSYDPTTDLSSYDKDSTVRLLRSNNIQNAVVTATDVHYVESRKVSESQFMQPNDILICMANGSKELVGKAGLFRIKDGYAYTFGSFMGCFRIELTIADPSFVFYLFQTCEFRDFIGLILAGSSINNLKPSNIESAEFQVPDRNEQCAIVAVLSDMDAEIAALERRRDKARAVKQGIMQQLLTGRVRLVESE